MTQFLPIANGTIENANTIKPVVVAIGGSDSAGLAGIQTDNQVIQSLGCHASNAITAITAQTNDDVLSSIEMNSAQFEDQLESVRAFNPKAIKIGLICSEHQIQQLLAWLKTFEQKPYVVWDPITVSTSGKRLGEVLSQEAIAPLVKVCDVITPNIIEASELSGIKVKGANTAARAANILLAMGAKAVYIKGGHYSQTDGFSQDYYQDAEQSFWLSHPKLKHNNQRGTGCMLASAIASGFALQYDRADAAVIAKVAINSAYKQAYALGEHTSLRGRPHLVDQKPCAEDMPLFSRTASIQALLESEAFPRCDEHPLGLYPVVDRASWIERLLAEGVSTIQLRVKDLSSSALEQEIKTAIAIAQQYDARLFINDYWQLAIKHKAYGVHLGQEDLDAADIQKIRAAGLRLGVSTHSHYEMARALALKPSYIAIGPVYPTTSKDMPWMPQGLSKLAYWQSILDYPIVAIGGIDVTRLKAVADTGVSGVAMISAITQAEDPEGTTKLMIRMLNTAP